jgi:hypothetical protein
MASPSDLGSDPAMSTLPFLAMIWPRPKSDRPGPGLTMSLHSWPIPLTSSTCRGGWNEARQVSYRHFWTNMGE